MHECYAMQILEKQRKQEQQRRTVTKSKAMKHKDHESQRWSRTQNHTNYLTKCLKLTSIKRFGEDVSILTFSRDILKRHNLSFNKIPNEMISNLYVLSLRVLNWVLRDINSTIISTINNYDILWYLIIIQKFFLITIPLRNKSWFISNNYTMFIWFVLKNPFSSNHIHSLRSRN